MTRMDDISQWINAEKWPTLAALLHREADGWLAEGRAPALQGLLQTIPANDRRANPWLNYWLGRSLLHTQLPEARRHLEQAFADFCRMGDLAGRCISCAAILDALWLEWNDCGALDPWIDELVCLRREVEAAGSSELLSRLSRSAFAALSIRSPGHADLPFWEGLSLKQLGLPEPISDTMLRGLQLMIHYTWGVGDRARSTLVLETLKSKMGKTEQQSFAHCIYYVVHAAHLHWFSDDSTACGELVEAGLALSERLGLPHWDIPLLNCILYKCCALGQTGEANHWLEVLRQRICLQPRPHDQAIHYHFLAHVAWLEGHGDEALPPLRQALEIAEASGFAYSPLYYNLALVAIHAGRGQWQAARQNLARVRREAAGFRSDNLLFMSHLQGAALAEAAGHHRFTSVYVRAALPIGARQRYFAVPWLRREMLARFCTLALAEGIEREYVRTLITALALPPPSQALPGAEHWPWSCRVRVLGSIRIQIGEEETGGDGKAAGTLEHLLLHLVAAGNEGGDVERLADALWPDLEGDIAYLRLKTAIHRLRRLLGGTNRVIHANRRVRLNPDKVWVDAWELERCAGQINNTPASLQAAIALYRGTLPSCLSVTPELQYFASRLEDAYACLVTRLANHAEQQGQWQTALTLWRRAVVVANQEPFHLNMIRCLENLKRCREARQLRLQCEGNALS